MEGHEACGEVVAVGVDGCRTGWVAAVARRVTARSIQTAICRFADFEALLHWHKRQPRRPVVAVDVPMGLPPEVGLRPCDVEARARLGRRWACVFEPPDRELFGHDFAGARAIVHRRRSDDPNHSFHILAQQGAGIMPKVAEVDRLLREDRSREAWLVETHPEVSFRELAAEDLPRKKSSIGKSHRLELLRREFDDIEERVREAPWLRREVGYDDLLDAYVALLSALRFATGPGSYIELGNGERDDEHLPMRIVI